MHNKALPYISLLSFFWGTNLVASRFGISEFDPLLFVALRLVIATLLFIPVFWLSGRRWPTDRVLWGQAMVSGILGVTVPIIAFTLALQYQSSGITSIFVTAAPALIVVAAHLFLPDEKITRNKGLGVVLALVGSLFLVLRGESGLAGVGRASPLGFILVMIGMVSETFNTMFVRRRMKETDPLTVTGIRLLVGTTAAILLMAAMSDISLREVTGAGYFSLGYAAVFGALVGQFLAFYVTRRFSATAFSLTGYLVPIVATVLGVFFLGEIVTWAMLVGVVFVGGGIYLINRPVFVQS